MNMEGEWASQIGPNNKYQYNGKELNDDFGLNWNDYGARFYDAAIGRWNHVDPLAEKYYAFTSYGYVANNPIKLIDPDGMRIEYADGMSKKDKRAIKKQIRKLRRGSRTFRKAWRDLKKSKHTHTVHSTTPDDMHVDAKNGDILRNGNSTDLYLNPSENSMGFPQEAAIAHEVGHSWRIDQGLDPEQTGTREGSDVTPENVVYAMKTRQYKEFEGTHFENVVRSELGLSLRDEYGEVSDNHTGNIMTVFGSKMLDFSKNRNVTIGKDRNYNYDGKKHYEKLKRRTRSKQSFQLNKYTDASKYN